MDCRRVVILGLLFVSLCAGCKALRGAGAPTEWSLLPKKNSAVAKSSPVMPSLDDKMPEEEVSLLSWTTNREPGGRKPKASTSVAWAVFRERTARLAESQAEKQKLLDEARLGYQSALEMDPKNLQAIVGLARVYTDMGKDERALETYAKALKDHPQQAALWHSLGEHYKTRREFMEAAKSYYQAHKFDPENRRHMQWLGFSLAAAGQPEEAFTWLSKANGDATAHYNMAQYYLQQNNEPMCRRHLKSSLDANSKHVEANELLVRLTQSPPPAPIVPAAATAPAPSGGTPAPSAAPAPSTPSAAAPTPATTTPAPALSSPLHDLPPVLPPSQTSAAAAPTRVTPAPATDLPTTTTQTPAAPSAPPAQRSSIVVPAPLAQIGFLPDADPQQK